MRLGPSISLLFAGAVLGFVAGRLTATSRREIVVMEPDPIWYVASPVPRPSAVATAKVAVHLPKRTPTPTPTPAPKASASPVATLAPAGAGGAELILPAAMETPAISRVRQLVGEQALRVEFVGEIPRYRVSRLRNPNRLYVDFEGTDVPGGEAGPRAGAAPIRELRARVVTGAGGQTIARIEVLLDEEEGALPEVFREEEAGSVVLRW